MQSILTAVAAVLAWLLLSAGCADDETGVL